MDRIKMGNFLTDLRKEKDLSQTDLADIIGVTFQAVSKWERGEAIPDISILEKLASFYNVSIDEIIKGEASVQQEKVTNKQEVIVETDESKESGGFLHQKRIFGFWFSLVYFVLFFLIGFCPFASTRFTDFSSVYITVNYYGIVFSSNFQIGNFFLLIQFITTLGIIACTMLYFACTTKKAFRALYITRLVLIVVNMLTLLMNIVFFFNDTSGVGVYLLFIIILTFDILYLALKHNRKSYILQDFQ
ncbi:MAG: helix-turn-helix domain-containing protein [Anaeroplasmataceae bacterium]|nr:helix-turn-helix domain-containing protein [Anaeroplasmataceae bacterium]